MCFSQCLCSCSFLWSWAIILSSVSSLSIIKQPLGTQPRMFFTLGNRLNILLTLGDGLFVCLKGDCSIQSFFQLQLCFCPLLIECLSVSTSAAGTFQKNVAGPRCSGPFVVGPMCCVKVSLSCQSRWGTKFAGTKCTLICSWLQCHVCWQYYSPITAMCTRQTLNSQVLPSQWSACSGTATSDAFLSH